MESLMCECPQGKRGSSIEKRFRHNDARQFLTVKEDTYCILRNGKIFRVLQHGKCRNHHSDIDFCLHHQTNCKLNKCTEIKGLVRICFKEFSKLIKLTLPNRTPQLEHSAWTFCRVSHSVQISSVTVFLLK